jgi:hypothetical protein
MRVTKAPKLLSDDFDEQSIEECLEINVVDQIALDS